MDQSQKPQANECSAQGQITKHFAEKQALASLGKKIFAEREAKASVLRACLVSSSLTLFVSGFITILRLSGH